MFYYGFLIENNRKNAVYVKLYLNTTDPKFEDKGRMLGISNSYIRTFKYFEHFGENEKTNNKFLSYLRLIEYTAKLDDLCPHFIPTIENLKTCTATRRKIRAPPLSLENEKKMLARLKEIANSHLGMYKQTYEEDMQLLKNDNTMSFNKRNSVILRSGEKKVPLFLHSLDIQRHDIHG